MRPASLQSGAYVSTPEETTAETYIGDWCISSSVLYHRHPQEIEEDICGEVGVVEYDVNGRECWDCHAVRSDEIWFIHRLHQL